MTSAERRLEAPRALDLAVEDRVEGAHVGEPGQLVGHRLALDLSRAGWRSRSRPRPGRRGTGAAPPPRARTGACGARSRGRPGTRGSCRAARASAPPGACTRADAGGSRHPRRPRRLAVLARLDALRADHPHARRPALRGPHRLLELVVVARRRCSRGRRRSSTGRARPASASQASTAVRTASATTPSRSRPIASASPTRRIASVSSPRWRWTSSIFEASCADMLLNSRPSCANSSWPSTGTGCLKSPRASRRAATRKVSICWVSARLTTPAEASASTGTPAGAAPITKRLRAIVFDSSAVLRKTASSSATPGRSRSDSILPR